MADIIVNDWLKLCTPKFALRNCQKIIDVKDVEKKLIEVIKYNTKIFTEPDMKEKKQWDKSTTAQIYVKALNNILMAMKGKRIFDRFGFDLHDNDASNRTGAKLLFDFDEWQYNMN